MRTRMRIPIVWQKWKLRNLAYSSTEKAQRKESDEVNVNCVISASSADQRFWCPSYRFIDLALFVVGLLAPI